MTCAVVNVDADSVIQRTMYYASGVPMAASIGRDEQPYLYNGKEFVEAHGWNTYDYGFRGYYAPIGRFTTIDPLAEQTPWQSPYAYAGNNFINAIDWMGLGGMTGFSHDYNLIVVNEDYDILYIDMDHWDQGVYMCDEEGWEFTTYWDILQFELIGSHGGGNYHVGDNIKGKFYSSGGGYYNKELGRWISYGTKPVEDPILMNDIKTYELFLQVCDIFQTDLFEYNLALFTRLAETAKINTEYVKFLKSFSTALTIAEGYNLFKRVQSEGWTLENISDAVSIGLSIYASKNPEMLIALIGVEGCKILGQGAVNLTNSINTQYGNYNYIMDIYWNGYK